MTVSTHPFPPLAATRWTLDASVSRVEFSVRQFWGLSTVHGRFARFEGELELGANGTGRAELRIEAASVETGIRRRDRHLRTSDYFGCDRHPLVRFAADVAAAPGGGFALTGRLDAGGSAIGLELVATVEDRDDRIELAAGASVDARALGMTWSPVGKPRTPVTLSVLACLRPAV